MRSISDAGLDLIKKHEGCRLNAYQDQRGIWTIGYGHTGSDVGPDTIWTQEQADHALGLYAATVALFVDKHTWDVATTQNQFDAMVDFAYNIGVGAFMTTDVLNFHRLGQYDKAADGFTHWEKIHLPNGSFVDDKGLIARRTDEIALYNTPDPS